MSKELDNPDARKYRHFASFAKRDGFRYGHIQSSISSRSSSGSSLSSHQLTPDAGRDGGKSVQNEDLEVRDAPSRDSVGSDSSSDECVEKHVDDGVVYSPRDGYIASNALQNGANRNDSSTYCRYLTSAYPSAVICDACKLSSLLDCAATQGS